VERVLLTPGEAAEALGLGKTKVYELMAGGLLRSVKIGASRRVPREALAEFIARMSAGAAT
jgi:excisionase family DNA binding protein